MKEFDRTCGGISTHFPNSPWLKEENKVFQENVTLKQFFTTFRWLRGNFGVRRVFPLAEGEIGIWKVSDFRVFIRQLPPGVHHSREYNFAAAVTFKANHFLNIKAELQKWDRSDLSCHVCLKVGTFASCWLPLIFRWCNCERGRASCQRSGLIRSGYCLQCWKRLLHDLWPDSQPDSATVALSLKSLVLLTCNQSESWAGLDWEYRALTVYSKELTTLNNKVQS